MRSGLNAPRSRSGCQECRRRRKKCDQAKPTCGLCSRAGKTCNYERELSWGGRPFGKSIFGQYSGNLTALKGEGGGKDFVYAPVAGKSDEKANAGPSKTEEGQGKGNVLKQDGEAIPVIKSEADMDVDVDVDLLPTRRNQLIPYSTPPHPDFSIISMPWELSPSPHLEYLNFLRVPWKDLLNHFVTVTSMSLSLHSSIRGYYITTLVPMALDRPCLLAAILQIAGQNRRALGINQSEEDLEGLKAVSISNLRQMLARPPPNSADLALATILALCVGDIVAGGERPGSWRTHLKGAAAMLEAANRDVGPGSDRTNMTQLHEFLRRWYLSIEATTLLGSVTEGIPPGYRTALRLSYDLGPSFIDEFLGFPPYLVRIFGEITHLAEEACKARRVVIDQNMDPDVAASLHASAQSRNETAFSLLADLDHKARSHASALINPDTEATLSEAHREDFLVLNESFHHAAAIHIHRRVLFTPSAFSDIQNRVKTIIRLVSSVRIVAAPSPAVAFLLPLFTAGCEAIEYVDQAAIEEILWNMHVQYGMGDVRVATNVLREIWKRRREGRDRELEWESLSGFSSGSCLCPSSLLAIRMLLGLAVL